ncbi:MAG: PQQ-like beta-propeller repeat protein [Planctomycetota bacterium]|jgi:outer membrane protein assembly factor BamB
MLKTLEMGCRRWATAVMLCGGLIMGAGAEAGDWNRFRGDNGTGVSNAKNVPTGWSDSSNVKWKTELPGPGFSSPIVVGDRVFVTSYSGYGESRENVGSKDKLVRHLVCVDKGSGKILWTKQVPGDANEDDYAPPGTTTHGYASHTPTSDGMHVYAFFGKSGVIAFDLNGNEKWRTNVGSGSDPRKWGSAASPIVHGDHLIVNAGAESGAVIALDKSSGSEVWRTEVEGLASSWVTPVVIGKQLVGSTATDMFALDPVSGKVAWQTKGVGARGAAGGVVSDGADMAYMAGGMQGGGSVALKIGGGGASEAWSGRGYASFNTPVLHNGYLYGCDDSGVAYCLDAKTGEVAFRARLASGEAVTDQGGPGGARGGMRGGPGGQRGGPGGQARGGQGGPRGGQGGPGGQARGGQGGPRGGQAGRGGPGGGQRGGRGGGGGMFAGRSYGSPILVDNKVYFTDTTGTTYVFVANPAKYELLSKNTLSDSSGFNGTPAAVDGALFVRSNMYLYCLSEN